MTTQPTVPTAAQMGALTLGRISALARAHVAQLAQQEIAYLREWMGEVGDESPQGFTLGDPRIAALEECAERIVALESNPALVVNIDWADPQGPFTSDEDYAQYLIHSPAEPDESDGECSECGRHGCRTCAYM